MYKSAAISAMRSRATPDGATSSPKIVTVPPHTRIPATDQGAHRYSFNLQGEQICFYSPEEVDGKNHFDWLQDLYKRFGDESFSLNSREPLQKIAEAVQGFDIPEKVSIDTCTKFGDHLERTHNIWQFGFIRYSTRGETIKKGLRSRPD